MELTPDQKQQFDRLLKGKLPLLKCPLCGKGSPSVFGGIIRPTVEAAAGGIDVSPHPPLRLAQLGCAECGHVMLFDCRKIGI